MFPVRERRDPDIPEEARRPPVVVWILVVVNLLAFLTEQGMVLGGDTRFPLEWGFVPRMLTVDPAHGVATIFTAMFLHAGWFHLLVNLWFLWFFGRSVEDALGHVRFSMLYLLGGVVAAIAHTLYDPSSTLPMLGASGAIGAVLAGYVSLFPWRRIVTIVPIIFIPVFLAIPAWVFVIEWFAINLFRGLGALHDAARGGVAWWAHIGGFLSGLALVRLLFPRHPKDREHPEIVVRNADGRRLTTTSSGWD